VRHRYVLTDAGRELVPVLLALTAWGDRWVTPDGGPPLQVHHDGCGAAATPTECCSACGSALHADDVSASPGPGARTAPGTALLATVLPGAHAAQALSALPQAESTQSSTD